MSFGSLPFHDSIVNKSERCKVKVKLVNISEYFPTLPARSRLLPLTKFDLCSLSTLHHLHNGFALLSFIRPIVRSPSFNFQPSSPDVQQQEAPCHVSNFDLAGFLSNTASLENLKIIFADTSQSKNCHAEKRHSC